MWRAAAGQLWRQDLSLRLGQQSQAPRSAPPLGADAVGRRAGGRSLARHRARGARALRVFCRRALGLQCAAAPRGHRVSEGRVARIDADHPLRRDPFVCRLGAGSHGAPRDCKSRGCGCRSKPYLDNCAVPQGGGQKRKAHRLCRRP